MCCNRRMIKEKLAYSQIEISFERISSAENFIKSDHSELTARAQNHFVWNYKLKCILKKFFTDFVSFMFTIYKLEQTFMPEEQSGVMNSFLALGISSHNSWN